MSLRSTMEAAGNYRAHYDAACKEILGCKQILANIMGEVLEEFRGLSPEEIERLIEPDSMRTGEPVGRNRPRIQGMRNEDTTILEGTIYYDILFRARCPGEAGREVGLRINVEAQNDYNPGYHISTRAMFYCARELSSQPGDLFVGMDYGKLEKVYSIWICMGERIPGEEQFTVSLYETKKRDIIGTTEEDRKHYQLMNAVIIRLGEDRRAKNDRIFRLLQALFGKELALEEKLARLKKLGIRIDDRLEKEVEEMCNLSEGIWRDGLQVGDRRGVERMSSLNLRLLKDKRYEDLKRASTDQEYRDKLFRQYQI